METTISYLAVKTVNESTGYEMQHSVAWYATVPLLFSLISLITIIGNAVVIMAFFTDQRIREKPSNIIILNLSITDFMIGLVILPVNTIQTVLERWPFGEVACRLLAVLDYTLCMVSVWTVVLISLDRYWLVKKELKYASFQTRRRVTVSIVCVWCAVTSFYTFISFGWTAIANQGSLVDFTDECELEFSFSIYTTLSVNAVEFVIPLLIIIFINIVLYIRIRNGPKGIVRRRLSCTDGQTTQYIAVSSFKLTQDTKRRSPNSYGAPSPLNSPQHSIDDYDLNACGSRNKRGRYTASYRSRVKIHAQHRKAGFFLAIFVGVFMFCWLPYQFTSIRLAFCGNCVFQITWDITNYLLWTNSAINPFLYALTNLRFRRKFLRLFDRGQGLCFRRKRTFHANRSGSEMQ